MIKITILLISHLKSVMKTHGNIWLSKINLIVFCLVILQIFIGCAEERDATGLYTTRISGESIDGVLDATWKRDASLDLRKDHSARYESMFEFNTMENRRSTTSTFGIGTWHYQDEKLHVKINATTTETKPVRYSDLPHTSVVEEEINMAFSVESNGDLILETDWDEGRFRFIKKQ
jgi:hypothetical protein